LQTFCLEKLSVQRRKQAKTVVLLVARARESDAKK
jgi:hypothetical protein